MARARHALTGARRSTVLLAVFGLVFLGTLLLILVDAPRPVWIGALVLLVATRLWYGKVLRDERTGRGAPRGPAPPPGWRSPSP